MAQPRTLEGATDLGDLERAVRSAGQAFVCDPDAPSADVWRPATTVPAATLAYWITGAIAACCAVLYLA